MPGRISLAAALLGAAFMLPIHAQAARPDTTGRPAGTPLRGNPSDTTIRAAAGPAAARSDSFAYHPSKSPWLAVGLSAALPGAGQIYDGNYWKAPVIWGLGIYWVSEWVSLNDKYHEFRDAYAADLRLTGSLRAADDLRLRDFYRDERDRFAWFLGGLYALNLLDAYVGAHLADFDVGPDLAADGRIVPRFSATVRIPF